MAPRLGRVRYLQSHVKDYVPKVGGGGLVNLIHSVLVHAKLDVTEQVGKFAFK